MIHTTNLVLFVTIIILIMIHSPSSFLEAFGAGTRLSETSKFIQRQTRQHETLLKEKHQQTMKKQYFASLIEKSNATTRMASSSTSLQQPQPQQHAQNFGATLPPGVGLPCVDSANGCYCNHFLPHLNPTDLQWYGTCEFCFDPKWTGWNCQTMVSSCVNGGSKNATLSNSTTEVCDCPPYASGVVCQDLQCTNSINGTGADKTRVTDPFTNGCGGYCEPGWGGLACDLCQTNSVCPGGEICWTDLASVGFEKNMLCNLTGALEYFATENNFSYMPGTIRCTKETPWAQTATGGANCSMTVFRSDKSTQLPANATQPPDSTPPNSGLWTRWLDPFLYCELKECGQIVAETTIDPVFGPIPAAAAMARDILVYCIYALCLLLTAVVAFAPIRTTANIGPKIVIAIFFVIVITIVVAIVAGMQQRPLISGGNRTEIVSLLCAETTCRCADGTGADDRVDCKNHIIGTVILPTLTGRTIVSCNRYTGDCRIEQSSLPYAIDLTGCVAAQCVDPAAVPSYDKDTPAPGANPDADTAGDRELFGTGSSANAALIWGPSGAVLGILGLLLLHFIWTCARQIPVMEKKWKEEIMLNRNANKYARKSLDDNNIAANNNNNCVNEANKNPSQSSSLLLHGVDEDDPTRPASARTHPFGSSNNNNKHNNNDVFSDEIKTVLKLENGTYDVPEAAMSKFFRKNNTTVNAGDANQQDQPRRRVLHGIDFEICSGHSLALLGGSGSGKTTTLNIIAASRVDGTVGGTLSVNGTAITPLLAASYRSMIGFVHQDDRLIEYLSVAQCIFHAARMRLPLPITNAQVAELVDEVIDELGLQECRDTLVGGARLRGVSGGERRRVSIACELVGYPKILILDEQTSGLDALSARRVMQLVLRLPHSPLKALQQFGRYFNFKPLIIFSIHQPSADIYALFDKVMVLVSGRRVVFGSARTALTDALSRCQLNVSDVVGMMKTTTTNNNNNVINNNNKCSSVGGVASVQNQNIIKKQQRHARKPSINLTDENNRRRSNGSSGHQQNQRQHYHQSQLSGGSIEQLFVATHKRNPSSVNNNNNLNKYGSFNSFAPELNNSNTNNNDGDDEVGTSREYGDAQDSTTALLPATNKENMNNNNNQDDNNNNNNNQNIISSYASDNDDEALDDDDEDRQQQYVNPAELLLQVALQLHNLFYVNNTKNPIGDIANDQNGKYREREEITIPIDNSKTAPLLDPNSPRTAALARGLNSSSAGNNNNNNNDNNDTSENINEPQSTTTNYSPRNNNNNNNNNTFNDYLSPNDAGINGSNHANAGAGGEVVEEPLVHILEVTNSMAEFNPTFWHQLLFLSRRSLDSFVGMFSLTAAHLFAATFLSFLFSFLYRHEGMDLAGTEDKAGMITFLLLIVAFSSVSCLELLVSERRVFSSDYDRGLYGVVPYFFVKIFFDFVPHRVMPTVILAVTSYFPMGLRQDGNGIHFAMFVAIMVLFSVWNVALCICVGLLTGDFGTGALVCSLIILWNTAFGGLMITPASIPSYFRPFKYISPQYFAYEASMVNELIGRTCVFNPVNENDHGESVQLSVPCADFILNLGLNPDAFVTDIMSLGIGTIGWLGVAVLLMKLVAMLRANH